MNELIVQPGHWNWNQAALTESFLTSISIFLGYSQKHKDFLKQVHENIWGSYQPDKYYYDSLKIVGKWMPPMLLAEINKFDNNYKKQLKIWYTELLTLEPMGDTNPLLSLIISPLSNTINNY